MDIFEVLAADHRHIVGLLDRLVTDEGAGILLRDEMVAALRAHEQLEHQHFYPALRIAELTADMVRECIAEHDEMGYQLLLGAHVTPLTPPWGIALRRLRTLVRHHINAEERRLFPLARRVLSDGQARDMGTAAQGGRRRT